MSSSAHEIMRSATCAAVQPRRVQTRPGAWTLDEQQQAPARTLLDGAAAGNGVVAGIPH
jgi:hypothetical protein